MLRRRLRRAFIFRGPLEPASARSSRDRRERSTDDRFCWLRSTAALKWRPTARTQTATKALNRTAAELKRRGWHTRTALVHGEPLRDLLGTVTAARAQLLVVGARGSGGVRHLLLGSVAEGALNQSPVAVLLAR